MIRKTLTTLFADVQGYTSRTGRQTREQHEQFIIELRAFIEKQAKEKNGNFVKSMGDGFMLTFESPTDAVACGINIQNKIRIKYASIRKQEKPILFRIGISTGEVMVDDTGDAYGEAVNIAARIEAFAIPGEVYISEATYLAMNKSEFNAIDLGPQKFKNIRQEVSVYRVFEGSADVITSLQKPIKKEIIYAISGIIAATVIGFLILFFSGKKSSDSATVPQSDLHAQFESMLQNKDFHAIIKTAEEILRDDPARGEVYTYLCESLLHLGDLQRAETYLNKAIEFAPENPAVYHMFSDLYAKNKDFDQAIIYLAEYLRREQDLEQKDIAIQRMRELENLKKEYSAIAKKQAEENDLIAAVPAATQQPETQQPDTPQQKQPGTEKEKIKRVDLKRPRPSPRPPQKKLRIMSTEQLQELRNRLKEYMLDDNYPTARDLLLSAEEENADNFAFFIFASKLYLKMDDYRKAEQMLMNAIDLEPESPTPYFGLSLVYEEMEEYEQSIEMVQEAIYRDSNEIRRRKMEEKITLIRDKMEKAK